MDELPLDVDLDMDLDVKHRGGRKRHLSQQEQFRARPSKIVLFSLSSAQIAGTRLETQQTGDRFLFCCVPVNYFKN
jgi:hypothetical protein